MTVQQIKEQIKDINEGLAEFSPSEKKQFGAKLLAKKKELEIELNKLELATKQVPKTKPTTPKATAQKVAKQKVVSKAKAKTSKALNSAKALLEKLRATKEQKSFNAGKTKDELEKDSKRKGLPVGKRISAEGNTYYEYRSNHADLSTKRKPYLEMGGEVGSKSHFKYYKVPNEQLWAIQECNKEFVDEFGGECIVIKHKRSEQDAIKEVSMLNGLGYSDYEKGGQLGFDKVLDKTTFSTGLKEYLKEDLIKSGYKDFSELKGSNVKETQKNIENKVRGFDSGKNTYLQANAIAESIHSIKVGELSESEKERLDYLQSKEDTDSLTKSENEEYEMLVEKYRETKDYKGYQRGGEVTSDIVDAIFYSNQKSKKGFANKIVETNFGEKTYTGLESMILNESYSPIEIAKAIFDSNEKRGFIETGFRRKTVDGLTQMIEDAREAKYEKGGKISNKGAYQNEPENKETYTRYADSLDGEKAKPAGWRYTDAGAKRLKISNPKTYVTKEHLEKYRGKYFTDSKGIKHRYVYIERRADKSDIKRGFPYLERGGKIDASFVRLETTDGNKITEQTSIPKADEALYYFWKRDKYSDVVYKITFEDGETLEGIIDLEPKEFHEGHKFNILTWHINTFWNNVARSNHSYISQSNKDEAKRLVNNYNLYDKGGSIPNNYEGKTDKQVWNEWSEEQKQHFLADHADVIGIGELGKWKDGKNDFSNLSHLTQVQLSLHISQGQYEIGGNI